MTLWLDAYWRRVLAVLRVAQVVLTLTGLTVSALNNWHLATILWTAVYLCSFGEARLLERELNTVTRQLEEKET